MNSTACIRPESVHARVLVVDDDPLQLKLSRIRLEHAGYAVETATSAEIALESAQRTRPDVILSDVHLGGLDGFALCRKVRETPELARVPVVLVTAHYPGGGASDLARRVGATRFLTRTPEFEDELEALRGALEEGVAPGTSDRSSALYEQHLRTNAHEITRLLGQARDAETRYRTLFEHANLAITVLSPDGVIIEANERWRSLLGVDPAAMVGRHIREYAANEAVRSSEEYRSYLVGAEHTAPWTLQRADGSELWMEFALTPLELDGREIVFSIGRDVTEAVLSKRAQAAAEAKYRSLVERFPDTIWTCSEDGDLDFATQNAEAVLGHAESEMRAGGVRSRAQFVHIDDTDAVTTAYHALIERGRAFDIEYRQRRSDGRWVWLRDRSTATYERDGVRYYEGITSDVTERKRLEQSLNQAQRIEAIGQLTGAIAHDFNNILSAILASSDFLIDGLAPNDPRRSDAEDIKRAATRAAALTRQLLAFSRRQVLQPTIVNLNNAVSGVEKMLQRLIGEDVEFTVEPCAELGLVRVDLGQLEQVIMNLVVNSREAMPWGGRLAVSTCNASVPPHGGSRTRSGEYVMLVVADTGCGMDDATKAHVFEPFFTTKPRDKGTGLGLSTWVWITLGDLVMHDRAR